MKSEIEMHKLLLKQIKKHLPVQIADLPEVKAFTQSVNSIYQTYENNIEIMSQASRVRERDFHSLDQSLTPEHRLKKLSLVKLKEAVEKLSKGETSVDITSDDITIIANYLKGEIGRRVEAEQKLTYTFELLTTLVSNFHSGILIKDENKKVLFTNARFCNIFSIEQKPGDLSGNDFSDFTERYKVLFSDQEGFVRNTQKMIDEHRTVGHDIVYMTNGSVFQRHFIPIYINSVYRGHLWEYTDITAQKEAQKALIMSEKQYRDIVEKSSDIIYKTDINGYFIFLNPVVERITGYSREELLHMKYTDLVKPELLEKTMIFYKRQLDKKIPSTYFEFPISTKAGEEKWMGQSVQLSETSSGVIEFTALAIDITARTQYQKTIRLQKEKYERIITNMNLGLIEVDSEEKIRYANPSFSALSGYSIKELIGSNAIDLFMNSKNEIIPQKIEQRVRGESDMYEVQVQNKQGEQRWWMISGAPNYDEKGRIRGSIGIHLDITEQKKMEKELEIQKEKAEASVKAQATFLANMSHEIRTPLNGIIGMIRELSYEELLHKQRKLVQNASIASQHLLSVLNNVLDISKIEAGELNLEHQHFQMRDIVKDVKTIMTVRAREKGILFGIDLHELNDLVYIGDPSRIRQILINLVGNSIKFTSEGGVYMDCEIDRSDPSLHKITFIVEDSGIGMDEIYQAQLFKKFSQEDPSISRKYGGTGLGMVITYELIQLMKGDINVKSIKGKGTRVVITLHLPPGDQLQLHPNDLAPMKEMDAKILVVEDNEFNRSVARHTLERFGCHVDEAENGELALQMLRKNTYSIILMDLQMPLKDGFETSRAIREELKLNTPIVALTANAFKSELERCLEVGMNDTVTKPYDEEKLMAVIYRLVNVEPHYDLTLGPEFPPNKTKNKIMPTNLYDLSILIKQSSNDPTFVQKMVRIFISQTRQLLPEIRVAFVQKDLNTLYRLTHKIKPSIDGMGITSLKQVVRSVEILAHKQEDSVELGTNLDLLCTTLERVLEQLAAEQFS